MEALGLTALELRMKLDEMRNDAVIMLKVDNKTVPLCTLETVTDDDTQTITLSNEG